MGSSTSPIPVLCSFGAFVNSTSPSSYVSNKHIRKTLIASSIIRQSALVNKAKATGFCVNGTANLRKFRSVDQRKHFLSVNIRLSGVSYELCFTSLRNLCRLVAQKRIQQIESVKLKSSVFSIFFYI